MKHSAFLLFSLCASLPLLAQEAVPTAPVAAAIPSTYTKDGLRITPIEIEPNDVAAMLNINMWRFQVHKPSRFQLEWRLELRQPGKDAVEMQTGLSSLSQDEELSLGLMPEEDKTVGTSPLIKIYLGARYKKDGVWWAGAYQIPGRRQNPIYDLGVSGGSNYSLGQAQNDGSITLMTFRDYEPSGKALPLKGELVLVLNAPKPPEPVQQ